MQREALDSTFSCPSITVRIRFDVNCKGYELVWLSNLRLPSTIDYIWQQNSLKILPLVAYNCKNIVIVIFYSGIMF